MVGTVDNKLIYHLGVLIPFWVLQLLAEILIIAFSALGLVALIALKDDSYYYDDSSQSCYTTSDGYEYCYPSTSYSSTTQLSSTYAIGYGALGAELGLGIIFLLTHITQIALFGRKKLTPAANFGFEITRAILWTIVFILTCVSIALSSLTVASIAFTVILWALYMGSLIYASVIYHRSRRGKYNGTYSGAYPTTYPQEQQQTSYAPGPYQNPTQFQTQGQYPQTAQYAQPSQYPQQGQYQNQGQYQAYNGQHQQSDLHRSVDMHSQQQQQQQPAPELESGSSLHQHSGAASPQPAVSPQMPHQQSAWAPPYPTNSPPPQELRSDTVPHVKH